MVYGPSPEMAARLALFNELSGITSVLNRADAMIKVYELSERDAPSIIALLAAGAERLAKVTTLLATGTPPPMSHKIVELDEAARSHLRAVPKSEYVRGLIAGADADPLLAQLLELLQVYAVQGRYYNLDLVAGRQVADESPDVLWRGLLASLITPSTYAGRDTSVAADIAAVQQEHNEALRRSLFGWREMYYRAWCNGLCGARAKQASVEIDPGRGMPQVESAAFRAG